MNEPAPGSAESSHRRKERNEAIDRLLTEFAPSKNHDLLSQMMVTICRLAVDETDRGDLKILNSALQELRYAFKVFDEYTDVPKVSIFGSARTPEDHPQYLQAKRFAELIEQSGWMVITGAGDGIMRAGHHGATREASFGVAISLPFEQGTNTIIADDPKLVMFRYFFTRKLIFVKEAKAIVLFPGGFGTQDEGFESLTLVQTMKSSPVPIVLCDEPGGTYWRRWEKYVNEVLLAEHMIDETDLSLFFVTDSAEAAAEEVLSFYRRYHSCRFVGPTFVMRLESPLSTDSLGKLNSDFSDIIVDGPIEQIDHPLDGEGGEYPGKSRLVFNVDRRNAGRLRQFINAINEAP